VEVIVKRLFLLLSLLLLFNVGTIFTSAARQKKPNDHPKLIRSYMNHRSADRVILQGNKAPAYEAAQLDTFLLAEFSFNNAGLPDDQGWFGMDLTSQIDTFFHIADTTELNGGDYGALLPLEGNQSLWCGAALGSSPLVCSYLGLPGYGSAWNQRFASISFPRTGDVVISYKIQWDSEPGYDETHVQYWDHNNRWVSILIQPPWWDFYDGQGVATEEFVIPGDSLADSLRVRFRFTSDGAWDDQDNLWPTDGASVIDSVRLADETGELDFQNFEEEEPGSHRTADGHWQASVPPAYGDFSGLFPAVEMLQEDICRRNGSWFWGFFNGSTDNYACGGHPDQAAVPFGREIHDEDWSYMLYLNNEIWSPYIDWTEDMEGLPVPVSASSAFLEFDAYRDNPIDNLVFYYWNIRGVKNGCPWEWPYGLLLHYSERPEWNRHRHQVDQLVPADAEQVQVALGVMDLCFVYCGIYGSGECHSHAPFLDNVRLIRVDSKGPLWVLENNRLFQDNFAQDGTTTGTVRMDMGIWGSSAYYDSVAITIFSNVGIDYHIPGDSTSGPAVYCHVKDVSPLKSGDAISGDLARWPAVFIGAGWTALRFDYVWYTGPPPSPKAGYYCVDLNDSLYTPGDTIWYYFSARDTEGNTNYWSRHTGIRLSESEVRMYPMEVTCLPANAVNGATDILYVDDCDITDTQPYFDTTFEMLALKPDRFDVLTYDWGGGNGLAGRVKNVPQQIIDSYQKIIWSSGALETSLIADGTGGVPNSNDFGLLYQFLDESPNRPGVYISGNNNAEEWVTLTGPDAINLRDTYMNFNLIEGDHVSLGQPLTPLVIGEPGSCLDHPSGPDLMLAYGGCSPIADFDVMQPVGGSSLAMSYSGSPAYGAVLTQVTPNAVGDTAKVVLSGFSYDAIRDDVRQSIPDRVEHLLDIIRWLENDVGDPTSARQVPLLRNDLAQNYPNPFNPTTMIHYSIEERTHVSLRIYDVTGRLVRTLVNEMKNPIPAGFSLKWDGTNDSGRRVSSGVYFYRIIAGNFQQTRKMVLMK
jgi:hypothetical protein